MADYILDKTYPWKFPGLNLFDNESIAGGLDWQQQTGSTWDHYYGLGDVITITLTDYLTTYQTGDEGEALLIKLPNGYELRCRIYVYEARIDYCRIDINPRLYDENGDLIASMTGTGATLGNGFNITGPGASMMTGYTLKFFIQATYYPQVPVENVTHPTSINIKCFPVFNGIVHGVDCESVNTGNIATRTGAYNEARDQLPEGQGSFQIYDYEMLNITSMETFEGYLKTHGVPFNDPVILPEGGPAGDDDTSGTGGGDGDYSGEGVGNYDDTSTAIDFPDLPTGGALTSGMLKGYVISSAELAAFKNKLWNMNAFDIATQFQKLVNDPMQCIISLHALPVLPTAASTGSNIKLGSFDTEATGLLITNQYVVVDCGTINIKRNWGSALDYAPYTKDVDIFLPFIGFRNIKIEDAQNSQLHIKYYVDVLTGSCLAFVKCGQSVLYTFSGNCLQHIPCTSQSSDLLHAQITAVGSTAVGLATGNPAAAVAGAAFGAVNTATAKNHVQRTGDLAGSSGLMGEFVPYVIMHKPVQSLAKNYNRFKGYPANITSRLGALTGYTEVEHIHLSSIPQATDAELNEIERLLKEGVVI